MLNFEAELRSQLHSQVHLENEASNFNRSAKTKVLLGLRSMA